MKYSICLATGYEGLVYPVNFCKPQDLVRHAQIAEKLGFHSVWGNDHITPPRYVRDHTTGSPKFYDVLITLAMIAQATTTLRVGTALLVIANREPVYLAKQLGHWTRCRRAIIMASDRAYQRSQTCVASNSPDGGEMTRDDFKIVTKLLQELSLT